jgi:hypothetical protein
VSKNVDAPRAKNDVNDDGVGLDVVAASAMGGERRRGRGWSAGLWGRGCARGDDAGRWCADVWNILRGGSGEGGFGYGEVSSEQTSSLP